MMALKEYTKAIEQYDRAIEGDPTTDFLLSRAQCYYDQGLYEKTLADLQTGLELLTIF